MKKLLSLFVTLPLLIQSAISTESSEISAQEFVQEFRDHFLPIEKGENALLESNFQIFLVDKGAWAENYFDVKYRFWTRNQHQWASNLELSRYQRIDDQPATKISQSQYKSVFINDKLYANHTISSFIECPFLEDILTKGPQIYLRLDQIRQHNPIEFARKFWHSFEYLVYPDEHSKSPFNLVKNPYGHYRFIFTNGPKYYIISSLVNVSVLERLDDHLFEIERTNEHEIN